MAERRWHEESKVVCDECGWKGDISDALEARHPFEPEETCLGCPVCKSIDYFKGLCFWPGCREEATCGAEGGFWCGEHYRKVTRNADEERRKDDASTKSKQE